MFLALIYLGLSYLELNKPFEFVDSCFSSNLISFQTLFLQIISLPLSLSFTFWDSHNVVSLKALRLCLLFLNLFSIFSSYSIISIFKFAYSLFYLCLLLNPHSEPFNLIIVFFSFRVSVGFFL